MAANSHKQPHEQKRVEPKIQSFFHSRRVTCPLDEKKNHPNICSPGGIRHITSLDHQIKVSLQQLSQKLAREGKYYELSIERGRDIYGKSYPCARCYGIQNLPIQWLTRWHVYANGYEIARFDDNYGYDCFDISPTCFMEKMECILDESGVQPLTDDEIKALEVVRMALRIIKVE